MSIAIITDGGIVNATLVEQAGDWAIARYRAKLSLTHAPTGMCVMSVVDATGMKVMLEPLLAELANVPKFDLQSFPTYAKQVKKICYGAKVTP